MLETIKNIQLNNILYCLEDESCLYIFCSHKNSIKVFVYSLPSFDIISSFIISHSLMEIVPKIDSDYIYAISQSGSLLLFDKFSGYLLSELYFGMSIPIDFKLFNDKIIGLCFVPISNEKDIFSLCSINPDSGQKTHQSQKINGPVTNICSDNEFVYSHCDGNIYKFDLNCDLVQNKQTDYYYKFLPLLSNNQLVLSSPQGKCSLFKTNDLENVWSFQINNRMFQPMISGSFMVCVSDKDISIVDIDQKQYKSIAHRHKINEFSCNNSIIVISGNDGDLIAYKMNSLETTQMTIFKNKYTIKSVKNYFITYDSQKMLVFQETGNL